MIRLMRYPLAAFLTIWATWATAAPDPLSEAADALVESAVKRPYGWGWPDAAPDEPAKKGKPAYIPIAMGPGETPAAGLVLWWPGKLRNEPKYLDAARQVARGVAASQLPSGRFPNPANFGATSAAGKEGLTPLPDRGPTRAALALLLTVYDENDPQQEPMRRAASRAAAWLLKQQAESGGWPVLYPPGAGVKNTSRIVRLDTTDTRDSTLAMLLAYETLGDPFQRRSVERSIEWLLKARSGAALPIGGGLWQPAYVLTAMPVDKMTEFPPAYDLLASRYAAQTLLATYTMLGDGQRLVAAELAVKSIDDLIKGDDGRWHQRYGFKGVALDNVQSAARNEPPGAFGDPMKPEAEASKADPGLAPLVDALVAARQLGREKFRERVAAGFSLRERLAIVVAGLGDEVMTADWPSEGYLKRVEAGQAAVTDLRARVGRLWGLYLRSVLEKHLAK
jgi:hypothetical protein